MPAPQVIEILANERTIRIRTDQWLNDRAPDPDVVWFTASSTVTGAFVVQSVVVAGKDIYVGVNQRCQGIISINYAPGEIESESGESLGAIINQLAINSTGASDPVAPSVVSADVLEDKGRIFFNEVLDAGSVPAVGSFVLMNATTTLPVILVEVYGNRVTLTLAAAVKPNFLVEGTYNRPANNMLQDFAGLEVPSILVPLVFENETATAFSKFITFEEFTDRWGEHNVEVASNRDNQTKSTNYAAVQQSFDWATDEIESTLRGGVLAVPLDFALYGNTVPPVVKEWAHVMAYRHLTSARGVDKMEVGQRGAFSTTTRLHRELKEVRDDIHLYKAGLKQLQAAVSSGGNMSAKVVDYIDAWLAQGVGWMDKTPTWRIFFT